MEALSGSLLARTWALEKIFQVVCFRHPPGHEHPVNFYIRELLRDDDLHCLKVPPGGQYIIKNLILISAAIVVGGTVRSRADGGKWR